MYKLRDTSLGTYRSYRQCCPRPRLTAAVLALKYPSHRDTSICPHQGRHGWNSHNELGATVSLAKRKLNTAQSAFPTGDGFCVGPLIFRWVPCALQPNLTPQRRTARPHSVLARAKQPGWTGGRTIDIASPGVAFFARLVLRSSSSSVPDSSKNREPLLNQGATPQVDYAHRTQFPRRRLVTAPRKPWTRESCLI